MLRCPQCQRYSVEYDPFTRRARCVYLADCMWSALCEDGRAALETVVAAAEHRNRIRAGESTRSAELSSGSEERHSTNLHYRVGIDEVGRGALAGPVVAGAYAQLIGRYYTPPWWPDVKDSKRLSSTKIESLARCLTTSGDQWGVGLATAAEIDHYGIVSATGKAMRRAWNMLLDRLPCGAGINETLVDGNSNFGNPSWTPVVRGDATVKEISAASIIAKFYRDRLMRGPFNTMYFSFGFDKHVGYGTALHRDRIYRCEPSDQHRLSWRCPLNGFPPEHTPCDQCRRDHNHKCCWRAASELRTGDVEKEAREVAEQTRLML
jgi:ribonuclease HII